MRLRIGMQKMVWAAGSNLLPAALCCLLVISVFRLWLWERDASEPHEYHTPAYISGIVYRSTWNQDRQLCMVSRQGKFLIRCGQNDGDLYNRLKNGAYAEVYMPDCKVECPKPAGNPHAFDQRNYLASRGIQYMAALNPNAIRLLPGADLPLAFRVKTGYIRMAARLRSALLDSLQNTIGERDAMVALAILTGDTGGIETEELQTYRDAGIAHIMAVSGMHAAFVLRILKPVLARRKIGFSLRNVLCAVGLLLFACLADFSPSVTRAVLQNAYILFAKALKRPYKTRNALCFALTVQLVANSYILYSSGMILSYAAAISILYIRPALRKRLAFFQKLPDGLTAGIAVNLGMFPLLATYFNSISPIGIFATIVASKLAYCICLTGFSTWALYALPVVSGPLLAAATRFLSAGLFFLRKISVVGSGLPPPLGAFRVPSMQPFYIALYYGALIVILQPLVFRFVKKHFLPFCIFCVLLFTMRGIRSHRTELLFFDVGQGFSAFVRTGKICGVIDGGDGKTDISTLLLQLGVGRIDFIFLTHGHADHAGGIPKILEEHQVGCLFVPDNPFDQGAEEICRLAASKDVPVIKICGCQEYQIGDLKTRICANSDAMRSEESAAVNNSSLVISIRNKDGSALFPGDIEEETEMAFAHSGYLGKTDVLAVAHHGSDGASKPENISIIWPEYAIISVGQKNRYGHPSERVVRTLQSLGTKLLRSDQCGAVKITIRKGNFHVWQKLKTSR